MRGAVFKTNSYLSIYDRKAPKGLFFYVKLKIIYFFSCLLYNVMEHYKCINKCARKAQSTQEVRCVQKRKENYDTGNKKNTD